MNKKIKTFLLALALLVSVFTTNAQVFAATDYETNIKSLDYYSEPFYYDADSNSITNLDDSNFEPAPFEESEITLEVLREDSNGRSISIGVETFTLTGGLKSYAAGVYTWSYNIDCPTSPFNKPDIVVYLQLQANFEDGFGTYIDIGNENRQPIETHIDYAKNYTFTSPSRTGYYRYHWFVELEGALPDDYNDTYPILLNRTGHKWTYEYTDGRGKVLLDPRADYMKGAVHERDPQLPGSYYTTYTSLTGVTLDRSLYDVHHMQPLSYGGDNSYANLIHLPKDLHKQVTGWFNGY